MTEFLGFTKVSGSEDIKELANLGNEIWSEHYEPIVGASQVNYMLEKFQSESAVKEQIKDGFEYYFIREDNINIGYFGITEKPQGLYLSKFYLKRDFRSKGYGRRTFEFIKQKCISCGCNKIVLNVNKHNDKSIAVYEKLGFKKTDSVTIDIGDGFSMDDFIYTYLMS